jgi:hypothetical protein
MTKEMLCICRKDGNNLYYGDFYEVCELTKAQKDAHFLMLKNECDYYVYECTVQYDLFNGKPVLFGGIKKLGGYWEEWFCKSWKYVATNYETA